MRLRSPLVIAYFYLLSNYTQRTVSFKTSPGMRRFLFTSTTSTAASASVPPTSSVASTTSAVAGASSAVVQSSSVIKEDEGPSAKRARVEVVSTASIASNPSTSYHVLGKHFNMLSSTQQQFAHNCPDNIWVEYPGIMLKLRSSKEKKEAKGVIAFDMDGTIIATKSGKTFAENEFDWKFWNEAVLSKLRALHEEGYFLAFISNQGGVGKKKDNVDGKAALQRKVDAIIDRVNVPIDFICSFENDIFRKPRTGMWDFLSIARWQASVEASKSSEETSSSFRLLYVGDAAGRPSHGTRSKDFSDTDLKVALNLGVEVSLPSFSNSFLSCCC